MGELQLHHARHKSRIFTCLANSTHQVLKWEQRLRIIVELAQQATHMHVL
jgi:hypothetical protein